MNHGKKPILNYIQRTADMAYFRLFKRKYVLLKKRKMLTKHRLST